MADQYRLTRMRARVPDAQREELCPKCGGTSLLRSDTHLCERCTAVLPSTIEAWQQQRDRYALRAVKLSEPVPHDWCITCLRPYAGLTPLQHEARCSARPLACVCGRRYWNASDMKAHQTYCRFLHPRVGAS